MSNSSILTNIEAFSFSLVRGLFCDEKVIKPLVKYRPIIQVLKNDDDRGEGDVFLIDEAMFSGLHLIIQRDSMQKSCTKALNSEKATYLSSSKFQ